jgi:hypothetical protein
LRPWRHGAILHPTQAAQHALHQTARRCDRERPLVSADVSPTTLEGGHDGIERYLVWLESINSRT